MILLLPAILSWPGLFSRADAYAAMPAGAGDFRYMRQQIFEEKSDLDVVFFGTSSVIYGVNTPYVQEQLSARLGRQARVITLGSFLEGEDRTYLVLRDLLQRRRVKMLVLKVVGDDAWQKEPNFASIYDAPNPWLYRLFLLGEDRRSMAGLPFRAQAALYAGAILGLPRHLLSLVRGNLTLAPPTARFLGSDAKRHGYNWNDATFEVYKPQIPAFSMDTVVHGVDSWKEIPCLRETLGSYPAHFDRKIGELLREHGVQLVILHMPLCSPGNAPESLHETVRWPDIFGIPAELVGVPERTLFAGMTEEQVKRLWCDFSHLNANGQDYFTRAITPGLVKLYAESLTPSGAVHSFER